VLYGFPYVVGRIGTHKIRGPLLTAAVEIVAEGANLEVRLADDVVRFNSLPFRSEDDSAAHDQALARILEATPAPPLSTAELSQFVEVVKRELPSIRIDATLDGHLGSPPTEPARWNLYVSLIRRLCSSRRWTGQGDLRGPNYSSEGGDAFVRLGWGHTVPSRDLRTP